MLHRSASSWVTPGAAVSETRETSKIGKTVLKKLQLQKLKGLPFRDIMEGRKEGEREETRLLPHIIYKNRLKARCQWLTPVIVAIWEVEIGRIKVQDQPRQTVRETLSLK
jgi:hypothetical protein